MQINAFNLVFSDILSTVLTLKCYKSFVYWQPLAYLLWRNVKVRSGKCILISHLSIAYGKIQVSFFRFKYRFILYCEMRHPCSRMRSTNEVSGGCRSLAGRLLEKWHTVDVKSEILYIGVNMIHRFKFETEETENYLINKKVGCHTVCLLLKLHKMFTPLPFKVVLQPVFRYAHNKWIGYSKWNSQYVKLWMEHFCMTFRANKNAVSHGQEFNCSNIGPLWSRLAFYH